MALFTISPSKIAAYFLFKCDRHLQWQMAKSNSSFAKHIPQIQQTSEESKLMTALTSGGFKWETELINNILKDKLVSVNGFVPKPKGKAFAVQDTLIALDSIEEDKWIFQSTFSVPQSFYDQYHIDKTVVRFSDCFPDLITNTGINKLRIVDAKASAKIQLKHKIQVAIYALMLEHILTANNIDAEVDMAVGGVWLGGETDYTAFNLSSILPHVRSLLKHDLMRIANLPPDQTTWHLFFECELCPFMKHCKQETQNTNNISRLPYISSENKAYLTSETVGIQTIEDVIQKMANPEAQQKLMLNSGSLKAKGQRLYNLAQALMSQEIIHHGSIPFLLPREEDIRICLAIEKEPSTKRLCAISISVEVSEKGSEYLASGVKTFIAQTSDQFTNIQTSLVEYVFSLLETIDQANSSIIKNINKRNRALDKHQKLDKNAAQLTLQLYSFDRYDQVNLINTLIDIIQNEEDPDLVIKASKIVLYLRTSKANQHFFSPKEANPNKFAREPIVSLLELLKQTFALPIETIWRLQDVLKVFLPNDPISEIDLLHYEMSNYMDTEIIHELWEFEHTGHSTDSIVDEIRHIMNIRSSSLQLLLNEIRSRPELENYTLSTLRPFALPKMDTKTDTIISQLSFISLNEVIIAGIDAKRSRNASQFERMVNETTYLLRNTGHNTFVIEHSSKDIEPDVFNAHLLWTADSNGEIEQSAYDDLAKYSTLPTWLPSTKHALICAIESVEVDEETGNQHVELRFNDNLGFDIDHVNTVGSHWYLGSIYTNSLYSRIKHTLEKKDLGAFVSLLKDTSTSTSKVHHPLYTHLMNEMNTWGFASSQQAVFQSMISQSTTLIWGPPGTGKSFVLGYALAGLIKIHQEQGKPLRILLSAFTHAAINNLLKGLSKRLSKLNLSVPIFKRGEQPELDENAPVPVLDVEDLLEFPNVTHENDILIYSGTSYAFGKIVKAHKNNRHAPIDYLIIDEGSQMTVPQAAQIWPLLNENTRIVLAGDHYQLPPIIKGEYPEPSDGEPLLTRSIFEALRYSNALAKKSGAPFNNIVFPLLEGWRMNDSLTQFSREELYTIPQSDQNGTEHGYSPATSQVATQQSPILPQTDELLSFILAPERAMILCIFEDTEQVQENPYEAHLCTTITEALRTSLKQKDEKFVVTDLYPQTEGGDQKFWQDGLFIVSPHHVQIREIKRQLKEKREWLAEPFVDTVDKMQGQEAEVVLISYGIADIEQAELESEFIYNRNRLNVSITRAKSKSIVLLSRQLLRGSAQVLNSDDASIGLDYMQKLEAWCRDGETFRSAYNGKSLTVHRR
ncbi:MAG: hypothetical protein CL916_09910 [Deltaproteobacteria bacterium]|nr:hypothetical protein [Deltaproteobacteria bacterium]